MINANNCVIIIPAKMSANYIKLFLSTFYFYVSSPPPIFLVNNGNLDNTEQIIQNYILKYNIKYIKLPENLESKKFNFGGVLEHTTSMQYVYDNFIKNKKEIEYIIFTHADVEFVNHQFWDKINSIYPFDFAYPGVVYPRCVFNKNPNEIIIMPIAISSHFVIITNSLLSELSNFNITIHPAIEQMDIFDNKLLTICYEPFTCLFQHILNFSNTIKQVDFKSFAIHYEGMATRLRVNPEDVFKDIINIDKYIQLKLQYLEKESLPFPEHFNITLKKLLQKRTIY